MGRFRIDRASAMLAWELFATMPVKLWVIQATYRADQDAIEYLAICNEFEPKAEGVEAPWYQIKLQTVIMPGAKTVQVFESFQKVA